MPSPPQAPPEGSARSPRTSPAHGAAAAPPAGWARRRGEPAKASSSCKEWLASALLCAWALPAPGKALVLLTLGPRRPAALRWSFPAGRGDLTS